MDSIYVYKGKLKEALTLIPSMSEPNKLEAVSYWNDAAKCLEDIVNPSVGHEGEQQLQQQQQRQQDQTSAQEFDTHVGAGSNNTASNTNEELSHSPITNMSMQLDIMSNIDDLNSQFDVSSILDGPLFNIPRNITEETEQIQANAIAEEISLLPITRSDAAQSRHHIDYNDTSTEACHDISPLLSIEPRDRQALMNASDRHFMLPCDNSASSSGGQMDDISDLVINQMPSQNYSMNINHRAFNKSNHIDIANSGGNFDNQNQLVTSCLEYIEPADVNCTIDNDITHDMSNGQFDREPKIAANDNGQLDCSLTSFGTTSTTDFCLNSNSDSLRPLQPIQSSLSSNDNIDNYLFSNQNQNELVEFDPRQSQLVSERGVSQLSPMSSEENVNFANIFPQQTTVTPANIDSKSCDKSDKNLNTCPVCGKSGFASKGNLKRHVKTHSGEKRFECLHCNSRFTENKSLKIHMRKHTGEKPYKCEFCGQLFAQKAVLNSHVTSLHINERKFVCKHCDKAFKQSSQLKLHQMRHDGTKIHACTECEWRFLTKGDLERHSRTHTGARPFVCKLCGNTFTRQQSLNEHLNRHYGKKPFSCHCGKEFSEMSACYKHIKGCTEDAQMPMVQG
uniref:Zinc finger protein 846 n=1 Tax=Aceria tosichella TaxID=561515 RepID=A0A6G1SAH4_9ACAR